MPGFCLRHDVDALLWQPHSRSQRDLWEHIATFNALGMQRALPSTAFSWHQKLHASFFLSFLFPFLKIWAVLIIFGLTYAVIMLDECQYFEDGRTNLFLCLYRRSMQNRNRSGYLTTRIVLANHLYIPVKLYSIECEQGVWQYPTWYLDSGFFRVIFKNAIDSAVVNVRRHLSWVISAESHYKWQHLGKMTMSRNKIYSVG